MNKYLAGAAVVAALVGLSGCNGFGPPTPEDPSGGLLSRPKPKPSEVVKLGSLNVNFVILLGEHTELVTRDGKLGVACGCINGEQPNFKFDPCASLPCTNGGGDRAAFERGLKVLQAVFDARQRGEKLEMVPEKP